MSRSTDSPAPNSRFHARLSKLGYASYEDYLRSPHWAERRRLAGDAADWTCACGRPATQIHHRTYARLGRERLRDLRAVCSDCHRKIHEYVRAGWSLAVATATVLADPAAPDPQTSEGRRKAAKDAQRRRAQKDKARKRKRRRERKNPPPPPPPESAVDTIARRVAAVGQDTTARNRPAGAAGSHRRSSST